jgi:hypothetical protein
MSPDDRQARLAVAAEEFNLHEHRDTGSRVATNLADGFNTLRDALFTRVYDDVEQVVGTDSMLMPISRVKSEMAAKMEIDIYQVAESVATAREQRYVTTEDDWYLSWLAQLRLGEGADSAGVNQRLSYYLVKTADERRRSFSSVLERVLPEARSAPLIVYRLLPLAIGIMTAVAFGDSALAQELRKRQIRLLPSILDCHDCRGSLLDNSEKCPQCGNPLWFYKWLTAE